MLAHKSAAHEPKWSDNWWYLIGKDKAQCFPPWSYYSRPVSTSEHNQIIIKEQLLYLLFPISSLFECEALSCATALWAAPLQLFFFHLFLKGLLNCIRQYTIFTLFGLHNYLCFCVHSSFRGRAQPGLHAFSDLCLQDAPGCLSISVGTCRIDGPGSQWDASDWSRLERGGARGRGEGDGEEGKAGVDVTSPAGPWHHSGRDRKSGNREGTVGDSVWTHWFLSWVNQTQRPLRLRPATPSSVYDPFMCKDATCAHLL